MRLKRLELQGFKSFAGKTVLDFPAAGVVGVVGPNGSGKSNIIDAIRWLLGEREAKNLRGLKSDDLIFSGGEGRARVGMAEAGIHFENISAGPGDFAEVSVKRKIFRDGTSQYFLNKDEVRLKDAVDFFAGAKLGTKGLAIINQGNSDLFVRATPAERREMIEEILGLRQFQLKRHDAELKLKSTEVNLEKVSAMIEELMPRLKLLRKQAAKWAEHADIKKELCDLENKYFALKVGELDSQSLALVPEIRKFDAEIERRRAELKKLQAELVSVEGAKPAESGAMDVIGRRERDIASRRSEIARDLGRLEARLEFAAASSGGNIGEARLVAALKDAREALSAVGESGSLEEVREAIVLVLEKIDSLFRKKEVDIGPLKSEIEAARVKLVAEEDVLSGELQKIAEERAGAERALAGFNGVFRKSFEAVEVKKDEISALENSRSRMQFDAERVNMRLSDLVAEIGRVGRDIAEFRDAPQVVSVAADFFPTAEKRMMRLRGDLFAIGEIDEAMLKEAKEVEERYVFLSTQTEDLRKASVDLQSLILDLKEKVRKDFNNSLELINTHFNDYFKLMFGGGKAKLVVIKREEAPVLGGVAELAAVGDLEDQDSVAEEKNEAAAGLDMEISLPKKGSKGLDVLSGGEKSLVSIAILFALVSVSAPPFLVLDEVDAALDENNTRRFANLIKEFSKKTQFIVVTHNRATMEAADILYGVTMGSDGVSKLLSVKFE